MSGVRVSLSPCVVSLAVKAVVCGTTYMGSTPIRHPTSIGAVVAQFLDMEKVTGSNPVSTIALRGNNLVRTRVRVPYAPCLGHQGFRRARGLVCNCEQNCIFPEDSGSCCCLTLTVSGEATPPFLNEHNLSAYSFGVANPWTDYSRTFPCPSGC